MSTSDRDAVIRRIQKLRAMTIANGASEKEATTALGLIAKLMADYSITETESSLKAERGSCKREFFRLILSTPEEWTIVLRTIEKLFHVEVWLSDTSEDIFGLGWPQKFRDYNFFGFPADTEAAVAMAEICFRSVILTSIGEGRVQPKGKNKAHYLTSFRAGMATRLKERIGELIPSSTMSSGTSLMVLKDQLVKVELNKLGLNFRLMRGKQIQVDPFAFRRGTAAAEGVDLGQLERLSSQAAITKAP